MNKVVMVFVVLMSMSACGKGDPGTNGQNAPVDSSILSQWTNTDTNSRIPALDLSQLQLGQVQSVTPVIDCAAMLNGKSDQSGTTPVNGVGHDQVGISGSSTSGLIQFGPLSHPDHNLNDVCYTIGQEEYSYEVEGNTLTLCDIKYSACSTFTK